MEAPSNRPPADPPADTSGSGTWSGRRTESARTLAIAVVALLLAALMAACSDDGGDDGAGRAGQADSVTSTTTTTSSTTPDAVDEDPADGEVFPGETWEVGDPADQGLDAATLELAREYAFAEGRNTQGVVVVRGGVIVAEWYADGSDAESYGASWSQAKSFTSAAIGIAIEEGLIPSVDEPMSTYYPEWADTEHADITLRDVLQMASGLNWNEDYDPSSAGGSQIIDMVAIEPDNLAYAASRPVEHPPGEVFNYSSGDTMLLSGVLHEATGMSAHEYAKEKIFDPIDMEPVDWWSSTEGHTLTYCCLDTPTRGFARFGLLFLRNGSWAGEQVVPETWVKESITGAPASPEVYGYQWWLDDIEGVPDDLFAAQGFDGQYTYVIPSLDLVISRNGTYVKDPGPPVADPVLFSVYPPAGLVEGRGTLPPEDWDEAEFLAPIVAAVQGA